jgi:hypothetical protein
MIRISFEQCRVHRLSLLLDCRLSSIDGNYKEPGKAHTSSSTSRLTGVFSMAIYVACTRAHTVTKNASGTSPSLSSTSSATRLEAAEVSYQQASESIKQLKKRPPKRDCRLKSADGKLAKTKTLLIGLDGPRRFCSLAKPGTHGEPRKSTGECACGTVL